MRNIFNILKSLEAKGHEIFEFKHAFRINGVLDIQKNYQSVFVLKDRKYYPYKTDGELLSIVSLLCSKMKSQPPLKQGKNGISYKEFKMRLEKAKIEGNIATSTDYALKCFEREHGVKGEDDLYFLYHGRSIKIGRSKDPRKRLSQFKTSLAGKHIMFVIPYKGFLEKELHGIFKQFRKEGEWFSMDIEITKIVEKYHQLKIRSDE